MQISNENSGISSLARQNILEKANQAFSGGERAEDFSKKINDFQCPWTHIWPLTWCRINDFGPHIVTLAPIHPPNLSVLQEKQYF